MINSAGWWFGTFNGLTTKGKSTGNHRFSYEIWDVPVIFPLSQSIETLFIFPGIWNDNPN